MSKIERHALIPRGATAASSAYSHGIAVDLGKTRLVFVTGQIAIDDAGEVVAFDFETQVRFVYDRVAAILDAGGLGMQNVAKAQIFLTDPRDLATASRIHDELLAEANAAVTFLGVNALVRKACRIELEVIAAAQLPDD